MARGEEGLQVLRDHGVEHRLARIPGCIGGNGWRHTSPHGQQGENGQARSCPQLYCSYVQYTSKKLPWGWGGNTWDAGSCRGSHAACATRRWQNSVWNSYTSLTGCSTGRSPEAFLTQTGSESTKAPEGATTTLANGIITV